MTELWITKSTTDVHRLIDNKLPQGSVCTGVTVTSLDEGTTEEYVAIINDQEVIVETPTEESASDVADAIVAHAPKPKKQLKPAAASAQVEGEDSPTETQADEAMGGPVPDEYEYDDSSDDDEGWETDTDKPKSKSKTKKKK